MKQALTWETQIYEIANKLQCILRQTFSYHTVTSTREKFIL